MSKSAELISLIDKYEKSKGEIIINSQDEFDAKEYLPKYATINCDKLCIDFERFKNYDVINNWDFTKCNELDIYCMTYMDINNSTLRNVKIDFRDCRYIQCVDYLINSITDCYNCTFHSSGDIRLIKNCNCCQIKTSCIDAINKCNHCEFNVGNVPKMTNCECCTVYISSEKLLRIKKHSFDNCNHCNIIIHNATICDENIVKGSKYTTFDFRKYMFHDNIVIDVDDNKFTRFINDDEYEYIKK